MPKIPTNFNMETNETQVVTTRISSRGRPQPSLDQVELLAWLELSWDFFQTDHWCRSHGQVKV